LHGQGSDGPKTLFATHYHELTRLAHSLPRLRNFSVAVKEWNDEIIFVRQVTPGASGRSFGIQVARLAGLPDGVVNRAKQILSTLNKGDSAPLPTSDSPPADIQLVEDPKEPQSSSGEPLSSSKKEKKKVRTFPVGVILKVGEITEFRSVGRRWRAHNISCMDYLGHLGIGVLWQRNLPMVQRCIA